MNNPCENCICNVDEYCRCEKLTVYETYQQGRADGVREFAEWFSEVGKVSEPLKEDTINRWLEDFNEWKLKEQE